MTLDLTRREVIDLAIRRALDSRSRDGGRDEEWMDVVAFKERAGWRPPAFPGASSQRWDIMREEEEKLLET